MWGNMKSAGCYCGKDHYETRDDFYSLFFPPIISLLPQVTMGAEAAGESCFHLVYKTF